MTGAACRADAARRRPTATVAAVSASSPAGAAVLRTRSRAGGFLAGAAIGLLGGLIGLGGAEFRLPLLIGVFGFVALQAVILNKAMSLIVVITAIPARLLSVPLGAVADQWTIILNLLAGSLAGAWLGATWATRMASATLYRVLGALLLLIAVALAANHLGTIPELHLAPAAQIPAAVVAGAGIGIVAALMGVAGGELLIPTIVLLYAVDIKLAGSLALAVSLPTMLVAFARYSRDQSFVVLREHRDFVAFMAAGSILGTLLGGLLLGIVPEGVIVPAAARRAALRFLAQGLAPQRCRGRLVGQGEDPSSSSSVRPLSTDSGRSATTSEPGRASSSRRLISSHWGFVPARALQREAAAQLLAVQHEDGVAALHRLGQATRPPCSYVPRSQDHAVASAPSKSLWPGRDPRPAPPGAGGGIERRPLRHGPRLHDPVDLQAQVVVVRGRPVLLDDETPALTPRIANCSCPSTRAGSVATASPRERDERLHRAGRALGMELARGPHPAHDAELARLRDDGVPAIAAPTAARSASSRAGDVISLTLARSDGSRAASRRASPRRSTPG